ncbi:hypothetical protein BC828DRAFT_388617 [Blastocladiella britannica]|nr:hypothetical protein BC828DRAFT_388617 [Blastocladiella britannica]
MRGLIFRIDGQSSMPVLKWAMEKGAELDGPKLELKSGFFNFCAIHSRVDLLDLVLHSAADVLAMDSGNQMVASAVEYDSIAMLEWWGRNRDKVAPQHLHCQSELSKAVQKDAADVIAWWWHAHMEVSSLTWQHVCIGALEHNSRRVQRWLLDHPSLVAFESGENHSWFVERCISALGTATPLTLAFFRGFFPDLDASAWLPLPKASYGSITAIHWFCTRARVAVASLLPLKPDIYVELLQQGRLVMLEWWLQAHLAAGHPFLLPPAAELARIFRSQRASHWWVHDVGGTRKIAVFVESDSGMVQYQPEVPLFLQ